MKATNYIEGILLFAAIVLYLVPLQGLATMQDMPIPILVCLGSYGLLLIARKPRGSKNTSIPSLASRTALHLAITGVILGISISYAATQDQSGLMGSTAAYLICIFYGIALSVLVFSFINRTPVKRSEDNHLPKHRFNTLELSI